MVATLMWAFNDQLYKGHSEGQGCLQCHQFFSAVGVKFATISLDYNTRYHAPEKELARRREEYAKS